MRRIYNSSLIIVIVFLSVSAYSALVTVVNPSFEIPALSEGSSSTTADSWYLNDGGGPYDSVYVQNLSDPSNLISPTATDGDNIAVILKHGYIHQNLIATLTANTTYTLTVDVGQYNGYPIPWTDTPGSGVYFNGIGGVRLGYDNLGGWHLGTLATKRLDQITFTEGGFTEVEVTFTTGDSHAGLGEELWINFYAIGDRSEYVAFDNVRLDATAVPIRGKGLSFIPLLLLHE